MVDPYYKDESVTIYNGDCAEILPQIEQVDLTVTSPPYDNLRDYEGYTFDFDSIAKGLYQVTKNGGVVVWVVADATINGSETGTSFIQVLKFKEIGFNIHDTMIYLKDNPTPVGGNNRYFQAFEYMFVLTKNKPHTFNPIIEKRRNKWSDKRTERKRSVTRDTAGDTTVAKTIPIKEEVKRGNAWTYIVSGGSTTKDAFAHEHPAIFPEQLANDHIRSWANPGDTVLDPMMGSGTTGKMALANGCKFVGIDISEKYCEFAVKRICEQQRMTFV